MVGTCELCRRENLVLTDHHLVPRARHNRRVRRDLGADRNRTAALCSSCHRQVHKLFTEKELERSYHTLELLLAHPAVLEWVGWVGKRPNWR